MVVNDAKSRVALIKLIENLKPHQRLLNNKEIIYKLGDNRASLAIRHKSAEILLYDGSFFGIAARAGTGDWVIKGQF